MKTRPGRKAGVRRLVSLILLLDFLMVASTGIGLQVGARGAYVSKIHMISGLVMVLLTFIHVVLELRKSESGG